MVAMKNRNSTDRTMANRLVHWALLPRYQWVKDIPDNLKSRAKWKRLGLTVNGDALPKAVWHGPQSFGSVLLYDEADTHLTKSVFYQA